MANNANANLQPKESVHLHQHTCALSCLVGIKMIYDFVHWNLVHPSLDSRLWGVHIYVVCSASGIVFPAKPFNNCAFHVILQCEKTQMGQVVRHKQCLFTISLYQWLQDLRGTISVGVLKSCYLCEVCWWFLVLETRNVLRQQMIEIFQQHHPWAQVRLRDHIMQNILLRSIGYSEHYSGTLP